jgi:uncharacterized protein DUF6200
MPDAAKAAAETAGSSAPLIVDLGKHRRKDIKQLREGRGKLLADVTSCIEELKTAGAVAAGAQPVVIIVRERRRKNVLWPLD